MMETTEIIENLYKMKTEEFFFKYFVKSPTWYFEKVLSITSQQEEIDMLDIFRSIISKKLDIDFGNSQIVGSAKIGFSLNPNKHLKQFDDDSDIDIAIISERIFNDLWKKLLEESASNYFINYARYSSCIFKGYLNDKTLSTDDFTDINIQNSFSEISKALRYELSIQHEINYRIYKDWRSFNIYQKKSIEKIKEKEVEK
ncbi:hypothetical protein [Liquorilactobacillus hordei]|uniref:hypothetical protein n=1 Tax=Liquorilactobacillus hordei TaxID=468911 RepID=UPI001CBF9AB5|nr:hypothetical protein [Liquorilactobacillus hordei]MBZ2405151.1 hypothetical protein [Liquorilactobacillus hordei]